MKSLEKKDFTCNYNMIARYRDQIVGSVLQIQHLKKNPEKNLKTWGNENQ